jgi:hypothetical protein
MAYLTREAIVAARLQTFDEPVPEWPDKDGNPSIAHLTEMPADEFVEFDTEIAKPANAKLGMFLILIYALRDPVTDERVLTREDLELLKKKSIRVLDRLQRIAMRLNGMGKEGREIAKNVSREAVSVETPTASREVETAST